MSRSPLQRVKWFSGRDSIKQDGPCARVSGLEFPGRVKVAPKRSIGGVSFGGVS